MVRASFTSFAQTSRHTITGIVITKRLSEPPHNRWTSLGGVAANKLGSSVRSCCLRHDQRRGSRNNIMRWCGSGRGLRLSSGASVRSSQMAWADLRAITRGRCGGLSQAERTTICVHAYSIQHPYRGQTQQVGQTVPMVPSRGNCGAMKTERKPNEIHWKQITCQQITLSK